LCFGFSPATVSRRHRPRAGRAPQRHPPQGLGRLTEHPQERPAHALRIGEPDIARDRLDRRLAGLQAQAGGLGAQALDRLGRRLTGLGQEGATKLAGAEAGGVGQALDRQRLAQMGTGEA